MATAGVSLLERQKRYQEAIDRLHQLLGMWHSLGATWLFLSAFCCCSQQKRC